MIQTNSIIYYSLVNNDLPIVVDDNVPGVVDSVSPDGGDDVVANLRVSWVYPEQYRKQPDVKRGIENTVVDFVRYMAREGFHDIGAVSIQ